MNILLIHHLEEMWDRGYKNYDTHFEKESLKVINFIKNNEFDEVVLVRFEDFELGDEHYSVGLHEHVDRVETYGYGWQREELEEQDPEGEGVRWADGCDHSEVVLLDDWIKDLKGHNVTLVGAFEDECIATISAALEQCGVEYKREDSLIVGSGVDYEFIATDEDIKEILDDDMDLRISIADHESMPDWPDVKQAIPKLLEAMEGYDWQDRNLMKEEAASSILGVLDGDDVVVDVKDLWFSEGLMNGTPDFEFTPDLTSSPTFAFRDSGRGFP